MALTLSYPGRSRERIVLFGPEGTGKSQAAFDIAAYLPPHATMYVIDNDNAWDRMLEGTTLDGDEVKVREEWRWEGDNKAGEFVRDGEYEDEDGNIVIFHTEGWTANKTAIEIIKGRAGRDDWCCIDSGSALWDDVQAWFTETIWDSSMADYFLQVRLKKAAAEKDAKALGALDGWVDWPVINPTYKQAVMKFLVTPPCHLIVTAEQAEVTKEDTDKETRTLYGGDVKARGQKRLGHNVQTVIRLRREQNGNHTAWTLKDRGGRTKVEREPITDVSFVDWYLLGIGGWVLEDEDEEKVAAPVVAKKAAVVVEKFTTTPAMTKG